MNSCYSFWTVGSDARITDVAKVAMINYNDLADSSKNIAKSSNLKIMNTLNQRGKRS